MRFYVEHGHGGRQGPYSKPEIRRLFLEGLIGADTLIVEEESGAGVSCLDFMEDPQEAPSPAVESAPAKPMGWREFLVLFAWPFDSLNQLSEQQSFKVLSIALVGLLPIGVVLFFGGQLEVRWSLTWTAFYFSVLWATFFYNIFPAPNIRVFTSVFCFMGTGVVSVSLLLQIYQLPLIIYWVSHSDSEILLVRVVCNILAVGIPEEVCKILVLMVLTRQINRHLPRTLLFYGFMSGLGFGIYEGLDYQVDRNFKLAESEGEYLFLNLLRLTSLPLLHALWTGLAGFFLGLAALFPRMRLRLGLLAIGIPAVLHGFYNAYGGSLASLGFALISVLMVSLYLAKQDQLVAALGGISAGEPEREEHSRE